MSEASVNESTEKPFLTVVSGNPTDEDVAVLVTVLAGAGAGGGEQGPEVRNDWGHPVDRLRPQWGAPSSFTNLRY
ncbi:acyl-CoA carboxylase subunit epsilon [Gordonia westfalica]|uniref:acyl-CoA carboxylase subunit epsilon n=1 Tax=Gordonia westfalica TaxID=158898 RepID=UPI00094260A9|nr:acyl-CoA carboxylase subunit epsilon [Gordonia westfalica]